jgi:hypothetical protein
VSALDELLSALAGVPAMPGALCRGQWAIFDEANDPGAIEAAIEICNLCPEMSRCGEWLDSLPQRQRPQGVVAGALRPLPVGRPRKSNHPTTTTKGTP